METRVLRFPMSAPQLNQDLSAPMILLATIWVSAAPVLTANKTLHEQRDIVFGIRELDHLPPERIFRVKCAAFTHSYIPLLLGILAFLALMTGFIGLAAKNVPLPSEQEHDRWLCYLVALMPASMFVGFAFGGGRDVLVMRRMLKEDELGLKGQKSEPSPFPEFDERTPAQ
jgi:hypothetical protein